MDKRVEVKRGLYSLERDKDQGDWTFYFNDEKGFDCFLRAMGMPRREDPSAWKLRGPIYLMNGAMIVKGIDFELDMKYTKGWRYRLYPLDLESTFPQYEKMKRALSPYNQWLEEKTNG